MYTNHGAVAAVGAWHVVGRRQQNQSLPVAPANPLSLARTNGPELSSAVDVLQAMENVATT